LKTERMCLINVKLFSEAAPRDAVDRFVENIAGAVEIALGLAFKAMAAEWRPVAKVEATGGENHAYVDEKLANRLKVLKKDKICYLRYDVGNVEYGSAKVSNVVVLVFLAGEKTMRVEVLAKSVAGIPARFDEVEWDREKWIRLAVAWVGKRGDARHYVVRVEPRVARREVEARMSRVLGLDSLAGLLLSDTACGRMISTPDPLLLKHFSMHFERVKLKDMGVTHTEVGLARLFKAITLDDKPFRELLGDIAERYSVRLRDLLDKAKGMAVDAIAKLSKDVDRVAEEAA